jgi:hypothetical protein
MALYPPVRSVERVIDLLQCLNRQPVSTLDLLHKQPGLHKASLIRLLQTLMSEGLGKTPGIVQGLASGLRSSLKPASQ